MRLKSRPSQRAVRNHLTFLGGGTQMEVAKPRQSRPRDEREAGASDAIKDWRKSRRDVRLWRNNVGFYKDGDRAIRYGLCTGSADFIGLHTLVISQAMVGKRIAVFLAVETKAPDGVVADHQETWLNEVSDAGAIAGVARDAGEADELVARYVERLTR